MPPFLKRGHCVYLTIQTSLLAVSLLAIRFLLALGVASLFAIYLLAISLLLALSILALLAVTLLASTVFYILWAIHLIESTLLEITFSKVTLTETRFSEIAFLEIAIIETGLHHRSLTAWSLCKSLTRTLSLRSETTLYILVESLGLTEELLQLLCVKNLRELAVILLLDLCTLLLCINTGLDILLNLLVCELLTTLQFGTALSQFLDILLVQRCELCRCCLVKTK